MATAAAIGAVTLLLVTTLDHPLTAILAASAATVLLIVFGFRPRTSTNSHPAARAVRSLTSRESVLPIGLAAGLFVSGHVNTLTVRTVVQETVPIVVLILAFALISAGIDRSGFFRYVTALTLQHSRGSINRLVISIFLLSSTLTYFLSNDIVILIMTPIALDICRQPGLEDARRILPLTCFIAANTSSMGLLFGSPTNIIVAVATGTGFLSYLTLMAAPTFIATASSLAVTCGALHLAPRTGGKATYPQRQTPLPPFHHGMTIWLGVFAAAVAGYSACIAAGLSFHWANALVIPLACYGITVTGREGMYFSSPSPSQLQETAADIPYGIIGFAISFFLVAFALADEISAESLVLWIESLPPYLHTSLTMLLTAALVNSINDLPSAATISVLLKHANDPLTVQAALSALNIGCYLTPIGALAGIMFFHIIRQHTEDDPSNSRTGIPTPLDLVRWGGIHFAAVTLITSALMPAYHTAVNLPLYR